MKFIVRGMVAAAAAAFAMTAAADTGVTVVEVPEPGTLALLATGIVAVAVTRLRKRK